MTMREQEGGGPVGMSSIVKNASFGNMFINLFRNLHDEILPLIPVDARTGRVSLKIGKRYENRAVGRG